MKLKDKIIANQVWFWATVSAAGLVLLAVLAGIIVLVVTMAGPKDEPIVKEPEPIVKVEEEKPVYGPPEESTFAPQDFQYDGQYLTCITQPSELGIDVSQHQGEIDWQAVKDAGVTFAIVRVGGRGYGAKGVLYTDDLAKSYYEGAKAAGIKVGAYFFSQATSVTEAEEEAALVLDFIKDWQLDMPVVYDWEQMLMAGSRTQNVDARVVTDCMKAFCQKIEASGNDAMIYFNPDHSDVQFYIEEVTAYDFWLAYYTQWMDYPYKVNMWQYTNQGVMPGIEGDVDINLYFPES